MRSEGSGHSAPTHRAFWKVPPGAPQPSSFVAEPGRVIRRKSRPSGFCHRPMVTWATARGCLDREEVCRRAFEGEGVLARVPVLVESSGDFS